MIGISGLVKIDWQFQREPLEVLEVLEFLSNGNYIICSTLVFWILHLREFVDQVSI